jgi:hypothetical protein
MGGIAVSANQKRSIATSLALLDETLCLFEEYAQGREVRSVLYQERNALTERQRNDLLMEIASIRATMREMKQTLSLSVHVVDVGKRIWGHGAGFWEVLAELEGRRLKAYGNVSVELSEHMDPRSAALLQGMMRVSEIVGSGTD